MVVMGFSGCYRLLNDDKLVARVGEVKLMQSKLKDIVLSGSSEGDSVRVTRKYIDDWVKKQVMMQEALKEMGSSPEIEKMVEDYRISLYRNGLNQQRLAGRIDTLITDSMVQLYFDEHRSDFVMDRTIVKGRILRVPEGYRQSTKLFGLMGSSSKDKQQDFLDICEKNGFELHVFENWVDFSEILSYLPIRRDRSYDYMLNKRTIQEMSDAENRYFIEITHTLKQGASAPYERVKDMVRLIIFKQRRGDIINFYQDSLYQAALLEGIITIKQ